MIYFFKITLLLSFALLANPVSSQNNADFKDSKLVCNKARITIEQLPGNGLLKENFIIPDSKSEFVETNSSWFKWEIGAPGRLAFKVTPLSSGDDIDFILFKLDGLEDNAKSKPVRWMMAGPNLGENNGSNSCLGATGLNDIATPLVNTERGCPINELNFLKSVDVNIGEYYALFINNYKSNNGISIEWEGNFEFQSSKDDCKDNLQITSVQRNDAGLVKADLFPNPCSEYLNATVIAPEDIDVIIQVVGLDGKIELEFSSYLYEGENALNILVSSLSKGGHFLKVQSKKWIDTFRFVKL
ncbi:MAG: T9SS type A sorting domain-containing protein [Chitinophagales bacterium]|nr:T9SS type A sorting domain-containing protein [Chitinophagales bacterium]